jgi:anti-sigma factor RsiW
MRCDQALALIPSYLDGELQEAQAGPLRKHLLDCQGCRGGAQAGKNLKRWFAAETSVVAGAIPQGFASRVARRAFAGDTGEPEIELLPARSPAVSAPAGRLRVAARGSEDPIHRFVLQATAAAALVVLALSLALRSQTLPSGSVMQAADVRGEITVEKALERLDQMNDAEEASKTSAIPSTSVTPSPKPETPRGP